MISLGCQSLGASTAMDWGGQYRGEPWATGVQAIDRVLVDVANSDQARLRSPATIKIRPFPRDVHLRLGLILPTRLLLVTSVYQPSIVPHIAQRDPTSNHELAQGLPKNPLKKATLASCFAVLLPVASPASRVPKVLPRCSSADPCTTIPYHSLSHLYPQP